MKYYNNGAAIGSGSTGTKGLRQVEGLGFVPQPGLETGLVEARMERPGDIPSDVEFVPIAAHLDMVGRGRLYHLDLPREVRALPDEFFTQSTVAGSGHMSGVGAAACAWAEQHRLKPFRARLQTSYRALGRNTIPAVGFEPVEVHLLSSGGGSGTAHTIHHIRARLVEGDHIDHVILALGPLAENDKEFTEKAGASAFALCLTSGLKDPSCPSWRARVVPYFYNGATRDYEDLTREIARDCLNRLESPMVEPLVADLRDYQADVAAAARELRTPGGVQLSEPPRCVNVVTVRTIFVPAEPWTERWVALLAAESARDLLGTAADVLDEAPTELEAASALGAEANDLLKRFLSPNENTELHAERLYSGANGDRAQAVSIWIGQCRNRVATSLATLTVRQKEAAQRGSNSSVGMASVKQKLALQRASHRFSAMAISLQEQSASRRADLESDRSRFSWATVAGQGQPGDLTKVRRAETRLLVAEVADEVTPVFVTVLEKAASQLSDEADSVETTIAAAVRFVHELDDEARRRANDYALALSGSGLRLALPIDDDVYGPGGRPDGQTIPLGRRTRMAVRIVAAQTRKRIVSENVPASDHLRLRQILGEEARRALPTPPTIWSLLQNDLPLLERVVASIDQLPSELDKGRIEVYGNARVGRYIEAAERFHGVLRRVRGLGSFMALDSGNEFELRLRRVDWGVPLMSINWFRSGMDNYLALRKQEGAALRCPVPWREAEMLAVYKQALDFDDAIFGTTSENDQDDSNRSGEQNGQDTRGGGYGHERSENNNGFRHGITADQMDEGSRNCVLPAASVVETARNGAEVDRNDLEGKNATGGRQAVLSRRHAGSKSLRRTTTGSWDGGCS